MSFYATKTFSCLGDAWNLFSSGAFEGGGDPGDSSADDGDNDLPPIESSGGDENQNEMSSNEGSDQGIGGASSDEDAGRSFSGGNDRKT